MSWEVFLTALGLMAVFEGLVFALAPLRFEEILDVLRRMPVSTRRTIGLSIIALGVALILIANAGTA